MSELFYRVCVNKITKKRIVLNKLLDEEVEIFDNALLITESDNQGIITYANRRFCNVSGYTKEELIGMHESITRHPDMPEGLFKAMEKIVSQKKIWRGYVKELSRDGRYYWVLMYVQAKLDENDEIVGSISTRKKAYTSSAQEAQEAYEKRRGEAFIDDPYFMRTELFLGDSIASRG